MQRSESRKETVGLTPLLTSRTSTRVATWNIRTMYEAGRTIQVVREMKNYKIGVLGLSETRWLQTVQLLYSGHTEDRAPYTEGVALMLAPEAQRALVDWHHSQVYHQGGHQAEHYPVLCSHQRCRRRKKGGILPATAGSDRQRRSQRHDHTGGRLQRQDWVR